jgi:hypothetical protein
MLQDKLNPLGPYSTPAATRLTTAERFYSLPASSSVVWISAPPTCYKALPTIGWYAFRLARSFHAGLS